MPLPRSSSSQKKKKKNLALKTSEALDPLNPLNLIQKPQDMPQSSPPLTIDLNSPGIDDTTFDSAHLAFAPSSSSDTQKVENAATEAENDIVREEVVEDEDAEEEVVEEEELKDEESGENVKEKWKQKDYEIFVGGLDRDAVEEDLEKVFKMVGDVVEVRLVKQPHSNRNKGFAFVRFATVDQARRAAKELKCTQVRHKICGVTRSNDKETLHLRNVCTAWTKDLLVEKLKAYELDNLEEVHLMDDPNNKGKNRGYAFLDFNTHMDAVAACNKLLKGNIFLGTDVRAEVAFAKSTEPDEEVMAKVKSVFLDGLPVTWDEAVVREQFKKYGEIENVELASNMLTAKRKDFGFITFQNRDAALACIDEVNKVGIDEGTGTKKVSMKATLRRPLQKRVSHQTVGGWRGRFLSRSNGRMGLRQRGINNNYSERPSRSREIIGRNFGGRVSGYSSYRTRGTVIEPQSPLERYGTRQRREVLGRVHAPSAHSMSGDLYLESSSCSRHEMEYGHDYLRPPAHSESTFRGPYADERYDSLLEYNESARSAAYDYPSVSGLKRSYSSIDDELVAPSFLPRRSRRESSLGMEAFPRLGISSYDECSETSRNDRYSNDRERYPLPPYEDRYFASSDSRSWYY